MLHYLDLPLGKSSQCLLAAIIAFVACCLSPVYTVAKPNIVLIVADDAGYADFGFHGSKVIRTPHLDQFSEQSMRFEQAYVTAAVCGPSRAGILTGRYQQRFGYEENNVPGYMSDSCLPDDEMGLPLDQTTVADRLKKLGYRTALIGKWHQGNAERFHPLHRGFDEFYGFRGGARSYFAFGPKNRNPRKEDRLERGLNSFAESDQYLTDAFADETIAFLRRNQASPFFVMLSFNAVHSPMQAEKNDLAKFPELNGKRRTLAAMTLSMDRACGRVFDALAELGLEENTIVVFTNDNGGPTDSNASNNDPLSGTKANHLEGGIRVPFLMRWPGVASAGSVFKHPISTLDLLPTFVAAAGGEVESLTSIDGVDLRPYVTGETQDRPHQTLFWKKEARGAIRDGDWKLLRYPDRPAELYYLPDDISEVNDLAAVHPERVRDMFRKLFEWEVTLKRPLWQLQRKYEAAAMERMDTYRKPLTHVDEAH
ncbi:sulfatase [Rhodopirellula sallentina]|uniref:N-acetylgalactosamine 6-sulfate sulfatase (GALNS) n=1 Tax=Rhodopirellula sallentina SM41 TaxID=1263870 RepID=M5UGI9_9BACT|nr:sulfatase [Rhodopirellula sallentina]EMI55128.1 N-acetylgalactosamine 6-sulfate sulfatase (GALNS) [Rhodopirellula sallentina SM41]